jgi:hypothetical protein
VKTWSKKNGHSNCISLTQFANQEHEDPENTTITSCGNCGVTVFLSEMDDDNRFTAYREADFFKQDTIDWSKSLVRQIGSTGGE